MFARCVLLILGISGIAQSQLSGRLYLEKETFAPGEPVFLYYEAMNSGADTLTVPKADPYSFCSGYQIHVSSDEKPQSSCMPMGSAGSCLSSSAELEAGQKLSERILLNF